MPSDSAAVFTSRSQDSASAGGVGRRAGATARLPSRMLPAEQASTGDSTVPATSRLRILFDLAYPGYLRYFDSTFRELTNRGHEVEVWFDGASKQRETLRALDALPSVWVGGERPRREDRLRKTARLPRTLADYARYLDPRFADAVYLRERAAKKLPKIFTPLRRIRKLPASFVSTLLKFLLIVDRALPRSQVLRGFLMERRVDIVVAGPNVYFHSVGQADLLASAKALGIPTVAAIASWDNLTTKGLIRGDPDTVAVWNEAQRREAIDLHHVPRERIVITGAYPFDKWFGRSPSRTPSVFKQQVGLPDDAPYILFVGSTASISAPEAEQEFVSEWLEALRASADPTLREISVLVRPHPYNSEHWSEYDLSRFGPVTIWPPVGSWPLTDIEQHDFFDSLYNAEVVVGINTSAMIEAAIVGRPVLTITPPEFGETQTGTLHFKHLLPENGGFVRRASSLEEHLVQLAAILGRPDELDECSSFVASFVRPLGLDTPATSVFADAIENAARSDSVPERHAAAWARVAVAAFELLDAIDRLTVDDFLRGGRQYERALKRGRKAVRRKRDAYRKAWRRGRRRLYGGVRARVPRSMRPLVRALRNARVASARRT
jgi:hypothetical protein